MFTDAGVAGHGDQRTGAAGATADRRREFRRAKRREEDGPGRGVARISLMNGDVSVRRGDSGDR